MGIGCFVLKTHMNAASLRTWENAFTQLRCVNASELLVCKKITCTQLRCVNKFTDKHFADAKCSTHQ